MRLSYDELNERLDAIEQATLTVTPGPWHRVTTAVMRRTKAPNTPQGILPMRTESIPIPDEEFWNDVEMHEVGIQEVLKRESGWIGAAEREEDAAHMARCDREFVLFLVSDYRRRLEEHKNDESSDELDAVQQFVDYFYLE